MIIGSNVNNWPGNLLLIAITCNKSDRLKLIVEATSQKLYRKITILLFIIWLHVVYIFASANMSRFEFSPCKKIKLFLVLAKVFDFENNPSRDYFQK